MEWRKAMNMSFGGLLRGAAFSALLLSSTFTGSALAQGEEPPPGLTPPSGAADVPGAETPAAETPAAETGAPAAETASGEGTPAEVKPNLPPLTPLLDLTTATGEPVLDAAAQPIRVPAMVDPNGNPVFGPEGLMVPVAIKYDEAGKPVIGADNKVQLLTDVEAPRVPLVGEDGQPVLGPTGLPLDAPALIGRDGRPVVDETGAPVALAVARDLNGNPLLTPDGKTIVAAPPIPDKLPLLGPDGNPIVGPQGPLLIPIERDIEGRPILGADGKPRRVKIKTDDEGQPLLGADGQPVPIGTEEEGPKHDLTPIGMFLQAHMVVKVVMILLVLMSVATWSYLFAKLGYFSSLNGATRRFLDIFNSAKTLDEAANKLGRRDTHPAAKMMLAALNEIELTAKTGKASTGEKRDHLTQRIGAAMGVAQNSAATELGAGMTMFAVVASNAPFIGLFGTVWGIMNSFIGIAETNTTNLAVVAPGIAEALFATGMGLFAAIPAAIFYNIFARRITQYNSLLENFSGQLLVRVSRELDQGA